MPQVTVNKSDGRPLRNWMLFVDGENLTMRGQELAKRQGQQFVPCRLYRRDSFVWMGTYQAAQSLTNAREASIHVEQFAIRAYYYTSVQGDEVALQEVREHLRALGFTPRVFKR